MGRELISVVADPLVGMVDSIQTWNNFPWGGTHLAYVV